MAKHITLEGLQAVLQLVKQDVQAVDAKIDGIQVPSIEVLSIIKKDINTNSTNISTIQESLNTVQTDLTEIKKIIKDSGVTASSDWNDITNKPDFADTLSLNDNKLKLLGNKTNEMSSVDITTTDDINNILNSIE